MSGSLPGSTAHAGRIMSSGVSDAAPVRITMGDDGHGAGLFPCRRECILPRGIVCVGPGSSELPRVAPSPSGHCLGAGLRASLAEGEEAFVLHSGQERSGARFENRSPGPRPGEAARGSDERPERLQHEAHRDPGVSQPTAWFERSAAGAFAHVGSVVLRGPVEVEEIDPGGREQNRDVVVNVIVVSVLVVAGRWRTRGSSGEDRRAWRGWVMRR